MSSLFEGQEVKLWHIDRPLPEIGISVVAVSDFNRALEMQGRTPVALAGDEYLLNCNYKGTRRYMEAFLQSGKEITLGNVTLHPANGEVLGETWWMTSVGNNDRGALVVPDSVAVSQAKDANLLLVQYKPGTDADEVLQKMIPIGLEWKAKGYRYTEKICLRLICPAGAWFWRGRWRNYKKM